MDTGAQEDMLGWYPAVVLFALRHSYSPELL